jgi:hypothetical protein
VNRRASFIAALAIALAGSPVASSWGAGILPGSFSYKLHAAVPLLTVEGESAPFQRVADVDKLFEVPFAGQAGEHADMSVMSALNVGSQEAVFDGSEVPKETITELPPGPTVDLDGIPPCSHEEFLRSVAERSAGCPAASQLGVVSALFGGALADRTYPLYKLAASHGHLATFGFPYEFLSQPVGLLVDADLRASGDYGITLSSTSIGFAKFLPAPFMTIWGVPAAATHDPERWNPETRKWGASLDGPPVPLIANATDCGAGTLEARARLLYWTAPDRWLPEDPEDPTYRSFAPAPDGCDRLAFAPRAELSATSDRTDSPAGIDLRLELPRNADPGGLETPPLESAALTFPRGMSVNPATADGLSGCTPEQIGLEGGGSTRSEPIRFDAEAPRCPPAAKVGNGAIDTPISEEPLEGDVYFATPFRNPFHSLLALYLVFDGPGFTAKLAARIEADPSSGQLEASIESLPHLPIDAVSLSLAGGVRGPLVTPIRCGEGPIELRLTPQSGPPAKIVSGHLYSGGGACAREGGADPSPSTFQAGSRDATANRSSPFVLRLEQNDIGAFEIALPRGLSARVRGVGLCGEADLRRAEEREGSGRGTAERGDPSCPASSRVGSLLVGTGSDLAPLFTQGSVYLAGPYREAPFSLVAITPALAGGTAEDPLFDLGTIVDRVALDVNPRTGALSARASGLSPVLNGIPLRIESVRLVLDRPGFMRNPSDCAGMEVAAEVQSGGGVRSSLRSGFRSVGCDQLGFAPRLDLSAPRGTERGQHPAIKAVLRAKAGEAGIAAAHVILPASEILDRGRLRSHCHASPLGPGGCPRDSIRGYATAWSGLIDGRLEGPVYLRSSGDGPPELVLALDGQPQMEVVGRVRLEKGRVRVDFSRLPDARLTKLVLTLRGGRRGFLTNARDLCDAAAHATAQLVSYAGVLRVRRASLGGPCGAADGRSGRLQKSAKRMEG